MQSYNLKSNKVGKQHLYHSTCTPPYSYTISTLYCNKVYNYGTNHSSYISSSNMSSKYHNSLYGKDLLLIGDGWNHTVQGFWYTVSHQAGSVAEKSDHWTANAAKRNLLCSFHAVNLDLSSSELSSDLVKNSKWFRNTFSGMMTLKDTYLVWTFFVRYCTAFRDLFY